jgi:glycosyltransferase 2 family protein
MCRDSNTSRTTLHDRFSDVDSTSEPPSELPKPTLRNHWFWKIGLQIVLMTIVVVFLSIAIQRAWVELHASPSEWRWDRLHWGWILAGLMLSMAGLAPLCIAWLQILRDFRQNIDWQAGAYAYCLGQLGKYVPGKAMVLVLRVGELHRRGAAVRPSVVSVFIETLTNFTTGAILGAILLQSMAVPPWLLWSATACIPIAALLLLPHSFRWVISRIAKSRVGRMPESVSQAIHGRFMLRTILWCVLSWILQGSALWAFVAGIQSDASVFTTQAWLVCVASASLGAVAGFLAMVPGGAGVREVAVIGLMSSIVPAPVALVSAVVSRLGSILGEVLLLVITWALDRFLPHRPNS